MKLLENPLLEALLRIAATRQLWLVLAVLPLFNLLCIAAHPTPGRIVTFLLIAVLAPACARVFPDREQVLMTPLSTASLVSGYVLCVALSALGLASAEVVAEVAAGYPPQPVLYLGAGMVLFSIPFGLACLYLRLRYPEVASLSLLMVLLSLPFLVGLAQIEPESIVRQMERAPSAAYMALVTVGYVLFRGALQCMYALRPETSTLRRMTVAFMTWYGVLLVTLLSAMDESNLSGRVVSDCLCLWGLLHLVWIGRLTREPVGLSQGEVRRLRRRFWARPWVWVLALSLGAVVPFTHIPGFLAEPARLWLQGALLSLWMLTFLLLNRLPRHRHPILLLFLLLLAPIVVPPWPVLGRLTRAASPGYVLLRGLRDTELQADSAALYGGAAILLALFLTWKSRGKR